MRYSSSVRRSRAPWARGERLVARRTPARRRRAASASASRVARRGRIELPYDARRHDSPPRRLAARRHRRRRRASPPAAREGIERRRRQDEPDIASGAKLFAERCSGCHTLGRRRRPGRRDEGPRPRARRRPELQHRARSSASRSSTRSATAASPARSCPRTSSSAKEAEQVAEFLAKYAGRGRRPATPAPGAVAAPRAPRRARPQARSAATPTRCAPRWPAAATSRAALDRVLALDERGARDPAASSRRCARARTRPRGDRRGQAGRRGRRRRRSRAMREVAGAGQGADRASWPRPRRELQHGARALPNLPDPDAPDEDTVLREVGEAADPERRATTSSSPASGSTWSAARACRGSRFAYLRGDLVLLELALVRWALDKLRGHGFEPVIPPVLVREEALYGTGFLPDTEQQIYRLPDDDLYLVGHERGRARLAARRRDPRRRRAAAPLRRLLVVLPPRGGRRRQGHARHLPRAPVRQGRDVLASSTPETRAPSTSACSRSRRRSCSELEIPYRVVDIAVDDLGASAAQKYDCEAWLPGQGALPRADLDARTRPTSRRGAWTSAAPAERRQAGDRCTRSTAPPSRSAARSSRCSRTASARTAAVALPEVLVPYGAPAALAAGVAALTADARDRRPRASARMSNVESRRVISNRRRTVGFVHTSAMRPAARVTRRSAVEQHAEPGRVDERHAGQVEHDGGLALADRVVEPPAELRRGGDVDLAGDGDHVGAAVELLLGELELGLGEGGQEDGSKLGMGTVMLPLPQADPPCQRKVWRFDYPGRPPPTHALSRAAWPPSAPRCSSPASPGRSPCAGRGPAAARSPAPGPCGSRGRTPTRSRCSTSGRRRGRTAAEAVGGGWVGYLGYDLGRRLERLPPPPPRPAPLPAFALAFYDHVVRCDAGGRWWFEALWTPARAAALREARAVRRAARRAGRARPARVSALVAGPPGRQPTWRPSRPAASASPPATCSRPTSACACRPSGTAIRRARGRRVGEACAPTAAPSYRGRGARWSARRPSSSCAGAAARW